LFRSWLSRQYGHLLSFLSDTLLFSGYQPRGDIVGIDEYPPYYFKGNLLWKILKLTMKLELKMCIPVQASPLSF